MRIVPMAEAHTLSKELLIARLLQRYTPHPEATPGPARYNNNQAQDDKIP